MSNKNSGDLGHVKNSQEPTAMARPQGVPFKKSVEPTQMIQKPTSTPVVIQKTTGSNNSGTGKSK